MLENKQTVRDFINSNMSQEMKFHIYDKEYKDITDKKTGHLHVESWDVGHVINSEGNITVWVEIQTVEKLDEEENL